MSTLSPARARGPRARRVAAIVLASATGTAALLLAPAASTSLILGAGLLALGFARPAWGVAALVFLVPMLSGVARGAILPGLAPNEILLLALTGVLLLRHALAPTRLPPHRGIRRGFLLFTCLGALVPMIAFVMRGGALSGVDLREAAVYVQYYLLFLVVLAGVRTRDDVALVLRALLFSSALVALLGVLQVLRVPPALWLVREVFSTPEHVERFGYLLTRRATSTLGAWNGLGVYLSVAVFTALAFFYVRPRRTDGRPFVSRRLLLAVLAIDAAGILASGSHTALVSLAAGCAGILVAVGRARHLLGWALLSLPAIVLLRETLRERLVVQFFSGESAVPLHLLSRWIFWQMIADELMRGTSWLFGIRPSIPPGAPWITEDSYYVHVLARGGLSFFAGFLALGTAFAATARRALRASSPLTRAVALALAATLLQLALVCVTGTFFRFSGYAEMIWVLAALATIALRVDAHAT